MNDRQNKCNAKQALAWWRELKGLSAEGDKTGKGDPGALARLRRAATPVEALTEGRAVELAILLGVAPQDHERLKRIGALAHVLAHVKDHRDGRMAEMLGPDDKGENAAMSTLRFQRLLAARTPAELMSRMRGAVRLLDGSANILDLAEAFCWWGDNIRIRWTYAYWGASHAAPPATPAASSSGPAQDAAGRLPETN